MTAGQAAYAESCAACHGRTLSGGGEAPALAGSVFMNTWGPHTTRQWLARPPDSDWLMHYRNYAGWSYSPLNQITPGTSEDCS